MGGTGSIGRDRLEGLIMREESGVDLLSSGTTTVAKNMFVCLQISVVSFHKIYQQTQN